MTEAFYFILGWLLSDFARAAARWWTRRQNQKAWTKGTLVPHGLGDLTTAPGPHRIVCSSCKEPRAVHNPNLPADWVCTLCLADMDRLTDEEKEDARQVAKLQEVLGGECPPEAFPLLRKPEDDPEPPF